MNAAAFPFSGMVSLSVHFTVAIGSPMLRFRKRAGSRIKL